MKTVIKMKILYYFTVGLSILQILFWSINYLGLFVILKNGFFNDGLDGFSSAWTTVQKRITYSYFVSLAIVSMSLFPLFKNNATACKILTVFYLVLLLVAFSVYCISCIPS